MNGKALSMRWLLAALSVLAGTSFLASACLTVAACTSDADCVEGTCHPAHHFCVTRAGDGGPSSSPDAGCASCGAAACEGAVCRPAADGCDVPEVCTGGVCPPDVRRDGAAGCLQECQRDGDCADAGSCGDGGVCAPRLGRGEACTSAARCASGACADGVCCDTACAGGCDSCNLPSAVGTCTVVQAGLPGTGPSCSPYLCDGSSAQCPTACSDGGCVAGSVCAGGACTGLLGTGQPCGHTGVCLSGFCVDGVCCDSACTGACQACNVDAGASTSGTCTPAAAGTDPKKACGPYACGGGTACASTCSAVVGTTGCASTARCCGSTCWSGGGWPDGTACSSGSDCASCACNTFYVDSDHDGYGSTTAASLCGATAPTGYATNLTDCCDTEPNAFPGQASYFTAPRTGCAGYDYDCSGGEERQYTVVGATCGNPGAGCINLCKATNVPGWTGGSVPACGVSGAYMASCVPGMLGNLCTCTVTTLDAGANPPAPRQGCR